MDDMDAYLFAVSEEEKELFEISAENKKRISQMA